MVILAMMMKMILMMTRQETVPKEMMMTMKIVGALTKNKMTMIMILRC